MAPTSILTYRDRSLLRLSKQVQHAALHATPAEIVDLERLVDATRAGAIDLTLARTRVADLRRAQQDRRAAA